jgi:predicted nucleic acid-binding protein
MNGTIENRFVLDTNAIIFLTTRDNVIPSDLENALNEAALFTSVISEIEVFSKPALPPDEEENLLSFLSERIIVIDLSSEIKKETIALRRSTKLKLPDSIVAATSIVLDAILLTDDKALLNLSWPGFRAQNIF